MYSIELIGQPVSNDLPEKPRQHPIYSLGLQIVITSLDSVSVIHRVRKALSEQSVAKFPATVFQLGKMTGEQYTNNRGESVPIYGDSLFLNLWKVDCDDGSFIILYRYENDDDGGSEAESLSIAKLLGENRLLIDRKDGPSYSHEDVIEGSLMWLEYGKSCIYMIPEGVSEADLSMLISMFAEVFPDLSGHSIIDSYRTWNTLTDRQQQTLFAYDINDLLKELKLTGAQPIKLKTLWKKCKEYLKSIRSCGDEDIENLLVDHVQSAQYGIIAWAEDIAQHPKDQSYALMCSIFDMPEISSKYGLRSYPTNRTDIYSPAIFTADFIHGFKKWLAG